VKKWLIFVEVALRATVAIPLLVSIGVTQVTLKTSHRLLERLGIWIEENVLHKSQR
jgi:hypothetical protein